MLLIAISDIALRNMLQSAYIVNSDYVSCCSWFIFMSMQLYIGAVPDFSLNVCNQINAKRQVLNLANPINDMNRSKRQIPMIPWNEFVPH